jgi:hypothetical protein
VQSQLGGRELRRPYLYSGGRSPGDVSHSFIWEAISACRALRIISSRTAPGGSNLASARRRFASSERWASRDWACLKAMLHELTSVLTGPNRMVQWSGSQFASRHKTN